MNRKTAETVARMIQKECCRFSLADLCEEWGVTTGDFDDFIAAGIAAGDYRPERIRLDAFAYPENGDVNGIADPADPTPENPAKMPFLVPSEKRKGEWRWQPEIDVASGKIIGWPEGTRASTYYKPCDDCAIFVDGDDKDWNDGEYCPGFLCPTDEGGDDYIVMLIDGTGHIVDWKPEEFYAWFETRKKGGAE